MILDGEFLFLFLIRRSQTNSYRTAGDCPWFDWMKPKSIINDKRTGKQDPLFATTPPVVDRIDSENERV